MYNSPEFVYTKTHLAILEEKIKKLIREDENLCEQQQLLKSIPGIEEITSVYILMATKGFTAFPNARKLPVIRE